MKTIRKLLVVARTTHYRHAGKLYAYTGYAREIDVWAELFPEVLIASACRDAPPAGDCSAFAGTNITICPVNEAGGDGWKPKLKQALQLPRIICQLLRAMWQADAIHIRCPCDLGLLGALLAPLFRRPLVAKYAGQWRTFAGEPWTWRLQRALLKSWWWRGPVTVYGDWPNQPANIIPFFASVLTEAQIERARAAARSPRSSGILRTLYVGRLSSAKNVDVLLRAVAAAKVPNRPVECTVVGEGPERASLEGLAAALDIRSRVRFTGGLRFDEVLREYEQADLLVLASDNEGWGKALSEGMAFGLICVGSERGLMPQMLAEGRGLLVPPGDVAALRAAIERVASDSEEAARMAKRAASWAQRFTLEGLGEALRQLLMKHWQIPLAPLPSKASRPQESSV